MTTGLKLVKKHLGPSNLSGSEADELRMSLYRFHGPLATFQTNLQMHDDDDDDSGLALEHLRPVIQRLAEALQIVNQYLAGGRTGKLLRGVKFDQRLKTALKCLDDASKLFTMAIMSDQQYVVINSPSPSHARFKTHPRPVAQQPWQSRPLSSPSTRMSSPSGHSSLNITKVSKSPAPSLLHGQN